MQALTCISHKHRYNDNEYNFKQDIFIEVLHIKTPICTRILISKDSLAVFTNYPSVSKDQASGLILFHPVVHGCFQLVGITIVILRI